MKSPDTNRERVLDCIRQHPEGIDDDQISLETGVSPRQQVYQIASLLSGEGLIKRISVVKPGKRKKIHNFPGDAEEQGSQVFSPGFTEAVPSWKKRLAALVAATGKVEEEILDGALASYARAFLEGQLEG